VPLRNSARKGAGNASKQSRHRKAPRRAWISAQNALLLNRRLSRLSAVAVSTPEVEWLERESTRQRLGVLDVMLCEVLQGLSTDAEAARVLRGLIRFEIFETGGVDLAVAAAANYRSLRGRGRTVRKTIDCLIATYCLEHHHALLHCDRDFDAFEESLSLQVVHPDNEVPAGS
jgi:predicted nucleic acid-binding protein